MRNPSTDDEIKKTEILHYLFDKPAPTHSFWGEAASDLGILMFLQTKEEEERTKLKRMLDQNISVDTMSHSKIQEFAGKIIRKEMKLSAIVGHHQITPSNRNPDTFNLLELLLRNTRMPAIEFWRLVAFIMLTEPDMLFFTPKASHGKTPRERMILDSETNIALNKDDQWVRLIGSALLHGDPAFVEKLIKWMSNPKNPRNQDSAEPFQQHILRTLLSLDHVPANLADRISNVSTDPEWKLDVGEAQFAAHWLKALNEAKTPAAKSIEFLAYIMGYFFDRPEFEYRFALFNALSESMVIEGMVEVITGLKPRPKMTQYPKLMAKLVQRLKSDTIKDAESRAKAILLMAALIDREITIANDPIFYECLYGDKKRPNNEVLFQSCCDNLISVMPTLLKNPTLIKHVFNDGVDLEVACYSADQDIPQWHQLLTHAEYPKKRVWKFYPYWSNELKVAIFSDKSKTGFAYKLMQQLTDPYFMGMSQAQRTGLSDQQIGCLSMCWEQGWWKDLIKKSDAKKLMKAGVDAGIFDAKYVAVQAIAHGKYDLLSACADKMSMEALFETLHGHLDARAKAILHTRIVQHETRVQKMLRCVERAYHDNVDKKDSEALQAHVGHTATKVIFSKNRQPLTQEELDVLEKLETACTPELIEKVRQQRKLSQSSVKQYQQKQ